MGYDRTETSLTKELIAEGIAVHYEDLGESLQTLQLNKENCLIVLTPAVPKDHRERNWLQQQGYTILKRSQVLGIITDAYQTIGVAGTHGKTTTSTLVAHLLKQSQIDTAAFLGGISTNYGTNLLLHKENKSTTKQWMVVEADEFDRSFLTLHPAIGIITSTDADHLDIYGEHDALKKSFADYAAQVTQTLFIKKELNLFNENSEEMKEQKQVYSYSIIQQADVWADRITIEGNRYWFDLHYFNQTIPKLCLGIPGMHNVENAVAASAAALAAGINKTELREGLSSFTGVKRRFEYIIKSKYLIYIDDYAHHPEELRAIISSVKQMYADKKITIIFQPHLYSRTRDFADGFAESLSMADNAILMDIYPARELPIQGVSSEMILNKMTLKEKCLCSKVDLLSTIDYIKPEVLLTLGAGDIDQFVEPLKILLEQRITVK
jgi:UDP-N-acetylmuramate--alanine ligase